MKKSFQCPNCPKSLSSQRWLMNHLQKRTPCDNKCRDCKYQGKDITDYKLHKLFDCDKAKTPSKIEEPKEDEMQIEEIQIEKKEETQLEEIEETQTEEMQIVLSEPQRLVPVQAKAVVSYYPIPIQDYDLEMYKTLKDLKLDGNLEDYDIEYYVMQTEKGKEEVDTTIDHKRNGDTQVNKVTKINIEVERRETIILRKRVKDARNALTNNMLYGALCSMVPSELEMDYLNRTATDLMYQVLHHDDPRLHNICLSDMSRVTVRVYSRITESEKCYWANHPKPIAPKIINDHARNLFSFLLEAGTQSLVSAVWKSEHINCLALNGEQGWSVILYEDNRSPESRLIVNKVPTTNLVYTMTEVDTSDRLMELVKNRKDEVIQLLQKLILSNVDIQKCLLECRRFCFVTMQKTLK